MYADQVLGVHRNVIDTQNEPVQKINSFDLHNLPSNNYYYNLLDNTQFVQLDKEFNGTYIHITDIGDYNIQISPSLNDFINYSDEIDGVVIEGNIEQLYIKINLDGIYDKNYIMFKNNHDIEENREWFLMNTSIGFYDDSWFNVSFVNCDYANWYTPPNTNWIVA